MYNEDMTTLGLTMQKFLLLCLFASLLLFSDAHAQTVGAWDARAVTPAVISDLGGALAYPGSGDYIYAIKGGSATFWRYSISGNSWSALTSIPESTGSAADIIAPGNGYVYLSCACATDYFYQYDIAGNSWSAALANPPGALGGGATDPSMTYDGSNLIYVLSGNGDNKLYSYSISGDSWDATLTDTPDGISGDFSTIVYTGSGDFIYLLRGSDKRFERYSISGNSYATMTSPPAISAYPNLAVANGVIYELRGPTSVGSGTTDFYTYSISGDSWTALTSITDAVDVGSDIEGIGSSADGFSLYATRGGGFDNFYRYTISAAASTGGSAGSSLLLAQRDAALMLARATPPTPPGNVAVVPQQCNSPCGATITFTYSALAVHRGRPMTFAFIDESGQTLASIYEPYANGKSYTMELKDLPPNSPLTGRLCAQFGSGSGCADVSSWTLFALDAGKIKLRAEIEGDRYRVRVHMPPYPNEGVEKSGVRLEVSENAKKIAAELLKKSGENIVTLPPGNYTFTFTPINARGDLGAPVALPLALKAFGEALALDVGVRVAEGVLANGFIAASNRLGNNGFEVFVERRGDALQFTSGDGAAVEARLNLTATLVPVHTTKVNGAPISEKEQFTFVFSCSPGGACKPVSSLAQKGNVISRAADIREGLVTAKTLDAVVTANMNGTLAHATVSVIGKELSGIEGALEFPAARLRGGKGEVAVTVADALGNKVAKIAPVGIAGAPARIALFDVAALVEPEEEGDVVARAILDYRDFAERALLLNLSFAEESAIAAEPLPTVPRLLQLLVMRDDGTGVQFALPCDESCGIGAVAAPTGAPLEVAVEENPDGTARASAGGVTLTYDAQNALPMLVGADEAGFARAELRARYASFGFGNIIGELRANESVARAAFAGTGGYLNLFPEVIERVIFDLAPLIINYSALQNLAPVIQSVEGARVVSQSRPVRIIREASEVGAPVSPLLNTLRNLLAP